MTAEIGIVIWWVIGSLSWAWLNWPGLHYFTWFDLFACVVMGVCGPIIGLSVLCTIGWRVLIDSRVLLKPIWPERD